MVVATSLAAAIAGHNHIVMAAQLVSVALVVWLVCVFAGYVHNLCFVWQQHAARRRDLLENTGVVDEATANRTAAVAAPVEYQDDGSVQAR